MNRKPLAFLADDSTLDGFRDLDVEDPDAWSKWSERIGPSALVPLGTGDALAWEIMRDYIDDALGHRAFEGSLEFSEDLDDFISWAVSAEEFARAAQEIAKLKPDDDPIFNELFDLQADQLGLPEEELRAQRSESLHIYQDLLAALNAYRGARMHLIVVL